MRIMGVLMLASTVGMVDRADRAVPAGHRRGRWPTCAATTSSTWRRPGARYAGPRARSATPSYYLHPAPEQLWAVVAEGTRVWERRVGDADFGQVADRPGPAAARHPAGRARTPRPSTSWSR